MLNIRSHMPKQNSSAAADISRIIFCDSMTIMVSILTIVPRMEQISVLTNATLDQVFLMMIVESNVAESMIMK